MDKDEKSANGGGRKRKLSNMEETPSKRRLRSHGMENPDQSRTEENGEPPIFKLPGELLAKIIDLVPMSQWPSLESVNRQFQKGVHGLWSPLYEIRLDEFVNNKEKKPYQIVDAALRKFLIRAPNICSISGYGECKSIRLPTIRLLSKFQHLQTIEFCRQSGGGVITAKNFISFLESSASRQSWKSLDVAGGLLWSRGIFGPMNTEFGTKINQPVLNLESFKFNQCTVRNFDRYLPIDWSRLRKLVIAESVGSYAEEMLSVIGQCTRLSHLEFTIPEYENGQPMYQDFMQVMADLHDLSVLNIGTMFPSGDQFRDSLLALLRDLGRRGRRITEFALNGFRSSDEILDAIIDYLPHLKLLELSDVENCTTPALERLTKKLGQLETLKFRTKGVLWSVDGAVIRSIAGNMSDLQCLHIDYKSEDFKSLGDLRRLKDLRIRRKALKNETIETWNRLGFGSCLVTLELSIPDDISPQVMACFFKNLPHLRSTKLTGVTDGILESMAEYCPNLVSIDLWDSPTITSNAIQIMIDRCSKLKCLRLNDLNHVRRDWFPTALAVRKYRKIKFFHSE